MSRYKFSWVLLILLLTDFVVLLPSLSILATADTIDLYPAADTFIVSNQPDTNFGSNTGLMAGKLSNTGLLHARIRFGGIPAEASIQSATLRLYCTMGSGSHTLAVQSASRSWHESILTWNTDGSTNRWTTPKSTYAMSNQTGYVSVDVTSHVQEWADGSRSNYGFHLSTDGTTRENHTFASRESATSSYRPKLEVTYSAPPPNPDLRSVSGIPSSVNVGEPFTVTVTAENDGGASPEGAINASVRYTDGTHDLAVDGPDASWADGRYNRDPEYYPIYNKYCQPMTAADHMVEAVDSDWQNTESHSMSFTVTPEKAGTLYVRVRTTMRNGPVENCDYRNDTSASGGTSATDQQGWTCRQYSVTVVADSAEIVEFNPPTGTLQRDTETEAKVRVRNTGSTRRSFWVGLSFAHSTATGDGWPVGWYDIQPIPTGILDPGDEEEVTFPVAIAETFRAGQYYAVSSVWDSFNETLYIMEKPRIDSTLWHPVEHPEWVDNADLGMLSFSLPDVDIPDSTWTIMDEFEIFSWLVERKGIQELYYEGKKPLFVLKASKTFDVYNGITVSAGGAIFIDLADLCELTPEGKEGWTTMWFASEIQGLTYHTSDGENKVIDAAIMMHNFDYDERGIADFKDHVLEFGKLTLPGGCITLAKYRDRDGFQGPSFDLCGTQKVGVTAENAQNIIDKVEIRSEDIRTALLARSGIQNQDIEIDKYVGYVCDILADYQNNAHVYRDFTYDDGDWPLQQGQPQTNLKMRLVNNDFYNSLHRFYIDVSEGASNLTFQSSDGTGDCRIYYRLNRRPNLATGDWDGRSPYNPNSTLQTCSIENPVVAGRYYIALHVSTSEPYEYEGVRFVATYGNEPLPQISITPSTLEFGSVEIDYYKDKTFTVENTGYGTLEGSASVSAPFNIYSGGSYSLSHGQQHTVIVRFSPTDEGSFNKNVTFTGGGGDTKPVSGEGTGTAVSPIIAPISNQSTIEGLPYTGPTPRLMLGTQPVTWSLVTYLSGMGIDPGTGVVDWPNPTLIGSPHEIMIRATNTAGYDEESWELTVTQHDSIPIPTDCQSFTYSSATSPVLSADPSQAKLIGLGPVAEGGGTLSITVKTYQFSNPIDIYFGLYSQEIDPDNIYLLTSGGAFQKLSEGLAPWKAYITGPINEYLFGDISTSSLPEGTYYLYLLVTPTDNLSNYYLWITSFGSCNSLKFTPEGTTFSYDSIGRTLELGTSEQITLITTACGDSVTVSSVTKTSGGAWLSASSGGGSKVILNLNAGASGVQAGSTYTGTVKVVAGGITDNLYVTLQVQDSGTGAYQLPTPPPFPGFGGPSP